MAKPRRMRSHRSDGALMPATARPLAALAVMGLSGPDGYAEVLLVLVSRVLEVASPGELVVAQPASHNRLVSHRMCRIFIGTRFSIGAARPARPRVRADPRARRSRVPPGRR